MMESQLKLSLDELKEKKEDFDREKTQLTDKYQTLLNDAKKTEVMIKNSLEKTTEKLNEATAELSTVKSSLEKEKALFEQKVFFVEKEISSVKE